MSRRSFLIVLLALFWLAAFTGLYWLLGTHRYIGPMPAARLGFAFTLSGLALLVVCKIFKIDTTPSV